MHVLPREHAFKHMYLDVSSIFIGIHLRKFKNPHLREHILFYHLHILRRKEEGESHHHVNDRGDGYGLVMSKVSIGDQCA